MFFHMDGWRWWHCIINCGTHGAATPQTNVSICKSNPNVTLLNCMYLAKQKLQKKKN